MNTNKQPFVVRMKNTNPNPSAVHINLVQSREEICEIARMKITNFLQLIVDFPEEISVSVIHGDRTSVFKIDCSKRNFSKILGAKGKMISSVRTMTLAITARHGFRSVVEVPYFSPDNQRFES